MDVFLARELLSATELRSYRLRGSGATVLVRHRTPDVAALGEVFYEHQYEPPADVAAVLHSLRRPLRIVDLGANIGMFDVFAMLRFPGAQITAVEPDPANVSILRRAMAGNGWSWDVVEAAASNEVGQIPFAAGRFTTSRIERGGEPVTAIDAFSLLDDVDLAKIDIEGGEWAILADPRTAALTAKALVLEYHPYLCPDRDPLEYASARLASAGYDVLPSIQFDSAHGMLWAWR